MAERTEKHISVPGIFFLCPSECTACAAAGLPPGLETTRGKENRGVARTCGDAGDDEPEDTGNGADDPAPVGDGRVGVAVGRVEGVVADLDHCCAVVRQLHADHNDSARATPAPTIQ